MASISAVGHRVASSVTTSLCVMVSPEKRTSVCVGLPNPRSASHRPAGLPSHRERGSAGRACCSRLRDRQRLGRDTAVARGQRVEPAPDRAQSRRAHIRLRCQRRRGGFDRLHSSYEGSLAEARASSGPGGRGSHPLAGMDHRRAGGNRHMPVAAPPRPASARADRVAAERPGRPSPRGPASIETSASTACASAASTSRVSWQ
jgi:hypothetical protein